MFLFDVGFQLSYLAVFGIIWMQPKLVHLLKPKNWILRKMWSLCTVSIAAQMGILPLSLYYFHQFPGLFFLSNLLIIPFLGGILIGGILVIILSLLELLPDFMAVFYNAIIELLNALIHWISSKEDFLFQGISMSFLLMITSYLFIIALFQVIFKFNTKKTRNFLMSVVLFQGVVLFEKIEYSNKEEFVLFHKSRKNIYGNRVGSTLFIKRKQDSSSLKEAVQIENYSVGEQLSFVRNQTPTNYFKIGNQDFLIVDDLGI
jgi:competence protein ComEC